MTMRMGWAYPREAPRRSPLTPGRGAPGRAAAPGLPAGEAGRRRPGTGPAPGRPGCRSPARAAGVPGSTPGRQRRTASGASTRRSDVGPWLAATAARSAAVRQTPSRYWSRPVSSTTRTPSPVSRSRSSATSRGGQERQVAGQHDDHVGDDVGEPGTERPRPGPPRGGCSRTRTTSGGTGCGGPDDDPLLGVARPRRGRRRASVRPPTSQLRLGLTAQPRRLAAGQDDGRVRRQRIHGVTVGRARGYRRRSWDESPAGHRCCASGARCTPPGPTPSPRRSRWRSGWPAPRWR